MAKRIYIPAEKVHGTVVGRDGDTFYVILETPRSVEHNGRTITFKYITIGEEHFVYVQDSDQGD